MTTIKIKGLKNLNRNIRKKLEDAVKSKELLSGIGKLVTTQAKGFTRLGKLASDESGIKSLKSSTVKNRERMSKHNQTGEWYKGPSKSNLSFSGQLIDSITAKIEDGKVTISPEGQRIPYKNKDGSAVKNTPSNEKLTEYLSKDRPFLKVGAKGRKSIVNQIKSFLRRFLK